MARQLAMFNMPSREDVEQLGERLLTMDDRLVRIEEMLKRLDAGTVEAARKPMPPRTKKPAAKTTKKAAAKTSRKKKAAT